MTELQVDNHENLIIEVSAVQRVVIKERPQGGSGHKLDSITVFLENFEPGRGKITIDHHGKSWSSYWGGMSGQDVATFVCRCDNHYLANCLAPNTPASDLDWKALPAWAKTHVIAKRRAGDLTAEDARELFDKAQTAFAEAIDRQSRDLLPLNYLHQVIGFEWWHAQMPEKVTPEYATLNAVIDRVRVALRPIVAGKVI